MLPNLSAQGSVVGGFTRTLPGDASIKALSLAAKGLFNPSNLIMLKATIFELDKEKIGVQLVRFYQEFSQNLRSDQVLFLLLAKTSSEVFFQPSTHWKCPESCLGLENLQKEVKNVAGDCNLQLWYRIDNTD